MMKKMLLFVALFATWQLQAQTGEDAAQKFAQLINPTALKEKLTILASDEMEGRETATPGQKKAAAYIESEFKKFGLKPGNGNSYQQYFPVYQDELTDEQFRINGVNYAWDKDYNFSINALQDGQFNYQNTVFAGYGIVDENANINEYKGLDVAGKLVIVLEGGPKDLMEKIKVPNNRFSPFGMYAKVMAVRRLGAAGILLVSNEYPREKPVSKMGNMYLKPNEGKPFINATISTAMTSALLGRTATLSWQQLADINPGTYYADVQITLRKKTNELQSSNVIAILPGTDKKEEYVFLTAHYDHLGKHDGKIYYGADDDGSGTTAVLQMAEAFSAAAKEGYKPHRTIVFMTVSGEEKGLWGSEYYSEHPIFPLDKTSVDLNTDMIGRLDTERKTADSLNYVYVIGHDKLSSELPIINEAVNKKYVGLNLDYKYDYPQDPNRIYYRSDHYNFAKKGVPILFFYDGMLLADYHKPTDTVDKINFELMSKRAQMIFYTAWEMANRDNMLVRDKPLNMPNAR
ncbi:MAG: M28 family peptidase [Hydrotalea flava]|nr:M28 family peptidase [Hydrotalea flava]NIM39430.1 M28 family peptidase [Hydrotalea flava]NIN04619.1 M28 family peptidase [Hydrotalea flava]NIN16291.1 M28 family peptidase [Hydrotalea flava]NIO95356.1 M28 family peptidase [Hydrotalea flava]